LIKIILPKIVNACKIVTQLYKNYASWFITIKNLGFNQTSVVRVHEDEHVRVESEINKV
jgi:hypothetical protein